MSTEQEEIDKILAPYSADGDVVDGAAEDAIEGEDLELAPEDNEELEDPIKPEQKTGHMNHDEWIAAGKDPDKYRGKAAYDDFGESLQTIKDLKDSFSAVTETMNVLKVQYENDANAKIEKERTVFELALKEARENDDVDAALEAQTKINNIEQPQTPAASPQLSTPVADYIIKNPLLDESSPQYDADFHRVWSATHDAALDRIVGGDRSKADEILTMDMVDRSMKAAMASTKALYPEKFTSPRNRRQTQPPAKGVNRQTTATNYEARLKALPSGSLNARDTTPNLDMYKVLVKIKGKEAADKYAKVILGDK